MNKITILFFANLRDKVGKKQIEIQVPAEATIRDLKQILKKSYPSLGPQLANVIVMVNKKHLYLDEDVIPPNAEVTFLPPIAGG